jgi:Lamin Tail Domain
MFATRTMVLRTLVAVCMQACAVPAAPASEAPSELHFELFARDASGRPLPLDNVARRPEFMLSSACPLASVELMLFEGEPDADLLDDLSALPLRAANDRRRVPSLAIQAGSQLRVAPRITLAKGAVYMLALPGTAHVRDGAPLGDGGPAFVAQVKTGDAPQAGASWLSTLPAPGQKAVPLNLATVFVASDGKVQPEPSASWNDAVWLQAADETVVPAQVERVDCKGVEGRAFACLRLELASELEPGERYELRSGRALRDASGALVEPLEATFETAGAADAAPPRFEQSHCLPDEANAQFGCLTRGDTWVELRLTADESVHVAVWAEPADGESAAAAQLVAAGEAVLRLEGLEPESTFRFQLRAKDLAGNSTQVRVTAGTIAPLPTISITEVLADPEGADTDREYVELWNFGSDPASLRGMALADESGAASAITSDVSLAPDERLLLVTDDFEASPRPSAAAPLTGAARRDTDPGAEVPPGVRLVRVGSSLTKGGLANGGEALYLRDEAGNRLSATPANAVGQGMCLQRISPNPRSAAKQDFGQSRCSPGR